MKNKVSLVMLGAFTSTDNLMVTVYASNPIRPVQQTPLPVLCISNLQMEPTYQLRVRSQVCAYL